jgi:hypothetical protein
MSSPEIQVENEKWLADLGAKLGDVTFYHKGEQFTERHVMDPDTIVETVLMTCGRFIGSRAVIWHKGEWLLIGSGTRKAYPSREAAEMVAIHHG